MATKIVVKQEIFSNKWSEEFLKAHESFVRKVRKGELPKPFLEIDYGTDGPNPYGVGASSLAGDVRRWWYGRKGIKPTMASDNDRPHDYSYTAEQGRIMENPVANALREMGYNLKVQVDAKGKNNGGIADGILCDPTSDTPCEVFESKHLGCLRYLDAFYKPLFKADKGYFWQAQSYQFALDLHSTLFVVTSQDASAVRKELTMQQGKIKKAKKAMEADDDTKDDYVMSIKEQYQPNPKVFAFRLYRMPSAYHINKRAKHMLDTLESNTPPARENNPHKDWICSDSFCQFRATCLQEGEYGKEIYKLPDVEVKQVWLS